MEAEKIRAALPQMAEARQAAVRALQVVEDKQDMSFRQKMEF